MITCISKDDDTLANPSGAVHYSPEVLEQIRRLAVDAFNAFSHGGLEIGGVLYGTREAELITVLACRELVSEHASGPRFVLSPADRAALTLLLNGQSEFEVVGWFRSHRRGEAELTSQDREILPLPFAESSVALVVKPTAWGPASAKSFIRLASGDYQPTSPAEFHIDAGKAAPTPVELVAEAKGPAIEIPAPEPPPAMEQPASVAVTAAPEQIVMLPDTGLPPAQPRPASRLWPIGAVCAAAILCAAAWYGGRTSSTLGLKAHAIAPGQVKIEWNHRWKPILAGASGVLEVEDGDATARIPLSAESLRSSSVTYGQQTNHIRIRLRVTQGDTRAEDSLEFAGTPLPTNNRVWSGSPSPSNAPTAPPPGEMVVAPAEQLAPAAQPAAPPASANSEPDQPLKPGPKLEQFARKSVDAPLAISAMPAPPEVVGGGSPVPALPDILHATPKTNPPPAATPSPAPASLPVRDPGYRGPRSGRLIWTGVLNRRGIVEIEGSRASTGSLIGALPGVPVSLRVLPAEIGREGLVVFTSEPSKVGVTEGPAKSNGWNQTSFRLDQTRSKDLVVIEGPNRPNDFARLAVRNEGRDCSVIVVDWVVVSEP